MGREVTKAVVQADDLTLVAAVDVSHLGEDAALLAGLPAAGVHIGKDLPAALGASGAQVAVDFTAPDVVFDNICCCLEQKVATVVGTTGLSSAQLNEIAQRAESACTPVLIAPNFAIGAVLMMLFAQQAAKYFDYAEIVELHHEKKLDAPSGTALKTAQMISAAKGMPMISSNGEKTKITLAGVRGGVCDGVHVHSVRMPGFVASQEVIFGAAGQTLTIRHDSISRESFMPGVLLAIRKVRELKGLTVGLENIL